GGSPVNLTEANPAWDAGPVYSADGTTLFYRAMKRPGFEADRYAIMAMDVATGKTREIAPDWDRSPSSLQPAADGKSLYVAAQSMGEYPLFRIDIGSGEVTELVADGTVSAFAVEGDTIALTRNSIDSGDTLHVAMGDGPLRQSTCPTSSAGPTSSSRSRARTMRRSMFTWSSPRASRRVAAIRSRS